MPIVFLQKKIMKSRTLLLLCCVLASISKTNAQSKLIHYWNFNSYTMADSFTATHDIAGISADFSTIDVNKAKILIAKKPGTSSMWVSKIDSIYPIATDYDTVNLRMSAAAGIALRVRNPSDSINMLFYVPTTNYKNIKLTYASQSSSVTKGQLHQMFSYSTDSGATWKTSGLSMASDSAWLIYHRTTVTFTTDTTVNNNAKLVFKITFNGNDTGSKGNNRFDNVSLEGDSIAVAGVALNTIPAPVVTLAPNPVANTLNITTSINGTAVVTISDIAGKRIMEATATNQNFNLDVANLVSGLYLVNIRDNNTGQSTNLKFIKQ